MAGAQPRSPSTPSADPLHLRGEPVTLHVNGRALAYPGRSSEPLLWALRELGLTGTKPGCGIGVCGACIVLMDGVVTRACQTRTTEAVERHVVTIEGLADPDGHGLHPVQQAFVDAGAPQCGWCMGGQILTAVSLLAEHPDPTDDQLDDAMSEVLCRCGAYGRIRAAVRAAASGGAQRGEPQP
jgi:isoquinoline 1-oxidoreductase alpha subunit